MEKTLNRLSGAETSTNVASCYRPASPLDHMDLSVVAVRHAIRRLAGNPTRRLEARETV